MTRAPWRAAAPETFRPPENPRLRLMASLVDRIDLGDEWDPDRLLIIPTPGGRLTGRGRCAAAGCPKRRCGAGSLCDSHQAQFSRSGSNDLEAWLVEGPRPLGVYLSLGQCSIADAAGNRCGRPVGDPQGLCDTHSQAWHVSRRKGGSFKEFLSRARPLQAIGPCVATSCFLVATYKEHQLCRVHYVGWIAQGRPTGAQLEVWATRVRQPMSGQILSLRGLHELTRLELLYGIGCRVAEHMATEPWHLRRFVDLLRAGDVDSVTEVDIDRLDGYNAYARFVIDRERLAYADPIAERMSDRWDLRVMGHRGTLDFTGIRQAWLREAVKGWAAGAPGRCALVERRCQPRRLDADALCGARERPRRRRGPIRPRACRHGAVLGTHLIVQDKTRPSLERPAARWDRRGRGPGPARGEGGRTRGQSSCHLRCPAGRPSSSTRTRARPGTPRAGRRHVRRGCRPAASGPRFLADDRSPGARRSRQGRWACLSTCC